jgi:ABC-2 type transport system permease protein
MSSYVKSEFYRLVHYKWTYLFIGICSTLLLSSNIVLAVCKYVDSTFPYATTKFSFSNVYSSMAFVFILCIAVTGMIFGNENNHHTMKNSISYGISRGTIYFGKLLIQIIYAIIAFTVIISIFVVSAYFLLENSGPEHLNVLIRAVLASLPLFIFALATTNCFIFIIEGSGMIMASCGVLIIIPLISNFLGMKFKFFAEVGNYLPYNILNDVTFNEVGKVLELYWGTSVGFRNCWIVGIVGTIFIAMIGFFVYRKKEIK